MAGAGASGAIAPIIGMISDQVTGSQNRMYGRASATKQYQRQRELNQQGKDLALEMWRDTNYSAQIEEMKRAGLNPNSLYGGVGAGGTTASTGSGGSASQAQATQGNSATSAGIGQMTQMSMIKDQKELVDAQTEATLAQANKTNIEASNIEEPIVAGVSKTLAERDKTKVEGEFLENTLDDRQLQEQAKAVGEFLKNDVSEAQVEKMTADIAQGWQALDNEAKKIKIQQFEAELKAKYPSMDAVAGGQLNNLIQTLYAKLGIQDNAKKVK